MEIKKPGVDEFVKKGDKKVKQPKPKISSKYLLSIEEGLRTEIRIEAIHASKDMSQYICDILKRRKEILDKK